MLRVLTIATAVMALTSMAAASPSVSEDVPIPGGMAALARALGIDPLDRARCVAELARVIYVNSKEYRERSDSILRRLGAHLAAVGKRSAQDAGAADLVPMPLPAAVWSQAVFRRPVATTDLFAAVMLDQRAALIAHGLAALDDETLAFLVEHPSVVTRLYERDASAFAAFAAHLRIRGNRVVPPGGERAVPLWESILRAKVERPEDFVRELFARNKGRLAYLYDTIGHLDPRRAAFALGLWIEDDRLRAERFSALALAASSSFQEWDVTKRPFSRPLYDLLFMLSRIQVASNGAPAFPASRSMWARAIAGAPGAPGTSGTPDLVDAAWLTEVLLSAHGRRRMDTLDQFAFGQRVFATADESTLPDAVDAIRALPRFRMLMLTLERMGVSRPALYAALARQAAHVSNLGPVRRRTALAELQGAIAVVARLARVKTIEQATAETLLAALGALPFPGARGDEGAVTAWLQLKLRPALAAADTSTFEGVLLEALAGARGRIPPKRMSFEGQHYAIDFVATEAARLRRFRERQGGPSIEAALDLHRAALRLAAGASGPDAIDAAMAQLTPLRSDPVAGPAVGRAIEKLTALRRSADPAGAADAATRVLEVVDVVTGEALLSISYAIDGGDPQGAARQDRNVARRHDFGFGKTGHDAQVRTAWGLPAQVFEGGVPWRVQGAILGLDVGLAPLALRRIDTDLRNVPGISSPERETFVASFGLMNPLELHDVTRDAIAEAVARGRRRVEALREPGSDVTGVVREIAMDGWRARALRWSIAHDPDRIASLFSMTDLLYLGGGRDLDLHAWGMSGMAVLGCLCTHVPPPGLRTALVGRPSLGLLGTLVADLNLRVAVTLHDLGVPAALAKSVLAAAVQDFVDRVRPSDADDWLAFVRTAQDVSRERIEDYVAAATAGGPVIPLAEAKQGR